MISIALATMLVLLLVGIWFIMGKRYALFFAMAVGGIWLINEKLIHDTQLITGAGIEKIGMEPLLRREGYNDIEIKAIIDAVAKSYGIMSTLPEINYCL